MTMSACLPDAASDALLHFTVSAPVTIRPQRPDDAALVVEFVRGLSAAARYQRFHATVNDVSEALLERLMRIAPPHETALLATCGAGRREFVVGEARYGRAVDAPDQHEFALAVSDAWQSVGVGTRLLRELMRRAALAGLRHLRGDVLVGNEPMLALAQRAGFRQRRHPTDARLARVERVLGAAEPGGGAAA